MSSLPFLFIHMLFLTIACTDPDPRHNAFQHSLMLRFIQDITIEMRTCLTEMEKAVSICEWDPYRHGDSKYCNFSVQCVEGAVHSIEVKCLDMCFHPEFTPSTVEVLTIFNCQQNYEFSTRTLPRAARTVRLALNRLFGRIDLDCLPANMSSLCLRSNRFTGPISLTRLPKGLVHLNIAMNKIRQSVVFYGNMPDVLKSVYLNGNSIQEIRPENPKDSVMKDRILKS